MIEDLDEEPCAGRIVETGPVDQVFTAPHPPYTKRLLESLPVIGGSRELAYLGRIVEQGDARDVIERPGHPYTQALVEAVPPRKQHTALGGELPDAADLPRGCRFHPRCPKRFEPCDRVDPPLVPAGEPAHEAACLLLDRP